MNGVNKKAKNRITSLRGSIFRENIEIQSVQNMVVSLEIKISSPPFAIRDVKHLIENYSILIEHYNFANNPKKSKFYEKR